MIRPRGPVYGFSGALVVVSLAAAALSFFVPDILGGPAVSQGNLRGTALVVMVLALPALVAATTLASRGSARALVVWYASVGFLLYQSVLFVFGTPFNSLFLLYVAMLSLSVWSLVAWLRQTDLTVFGERFDPRLPARAIAAFAMALTALNTLVWLRTIVPAVGGDQPDSFLDGLGMTTNPVFVQDLVLWLPLLAVAAYWLWYREPWAELVAGAMLTMLVFEGVCVATHQWFGVMADPNTDFASIGAIPLSLGLAVAISVPLFYYYRNLDRTGQVDAVPTADSPRTGEHRMEPVR